MASLLSNTSSYRLKSIGVGSGQAITTINDTTLTTPTWKDITFTSNTNIVTGTTLFGTNEANHLIGEFGLRDTNNILFARTLNERDIYTKVTGEQLRVTWSINVNYGGNL